MKAKEIQVGQMYTAKVSGKVVPVRVLSIDTQDVFGRQRTSYRCRNSRTGREIIVRSPQKFHCDYPSTIEALLNCGVPAEELQ